VEALRFQGPRIVAHHQLPLSPTPSAARRLTTLSCISSLASFSFSRNIASPAILDLSSTPSTVFSPSATDQRRFSAIATTSSIVHAPSRAQAHYVCACATLLPWSISTNLGLCNLGSSTLRCCPDHYLSSPLLLSR
jgi:hypothetical protein